MNNKTPTYREKGRAVFLAAIMVLSVVAMSAAFAGSAAAQAATNVAPDDTTYNEGDEISGTVTVDGNADESVFVFLDEDENGQYDSGENSVEVDVSDGDSQTTYDFDGLETDGVLGTQVAAVTGSSLDDGTAADTGATAPVTLQNDLEIELGSNFFSTQEDATGQVTVTNNGSVDAEGVTIDLSFAEPGGTSGTASSGPLTLAPGESETVEVDIVSGDTEIGFADNGLSTTVNGDDFTETTEEKNVYVTADENVLVGGDVSDDSVPKQKIDTRDNVEVTITIDSAPSFMSGAEGDVIVDSVLLGDDWNDLSTVNPAVDSSNYFESSQPVGSANELDEYQLRLPGFGDDTGDDEIVYRVEAVPVNDLSEGFDAFDGVTRPLLQGDGDTNRDIELERLVVPDELEVTQSSESAIADGEDTITFTATVFGDENGEPFEGEQVSIETVTGEDITFDQTTATTDENGEVEFTVSSGTQQTAEFRIVADSADNPEDPSDPLVQERTKSFVLSGEAELQGNVYDKTTTDPIEDGSVWVAFGDDYEDDTLEVTVDLDALDAAYDNFTRADEDVNGDTVYVRLVQNETGDLAEGEVVPQRTYDVREPGFGGEKVIEPTNPDVSVRELQALDTNDLRQGSGFVAIDDNDDDSVTFEITRLNPENYKLDLSLTADSPATFGNEEDLRVADDRGANFTRVWKAEGAPVQTTPGSLTIDGTNTDVRVSNNITAPSDTIELGSVDAQDVEVDQNMTLAATQQLAEASDAAPGIPGANFVDSPGFENSYGEETDGTNQYGQYTLNRLPSNFQDGRQYVAIASAPGFDTDFQDVVATEDGELTFTQSQGSNDFQLQPIPVTPDEVNITNLGIHPPVDQTGGAPDFDEIELFDDMSDEFDQPIPRDGSVDVMLVETRGDGALTNATVDLDVPDDINDVNTPQFNSTAEILEDEDGNAFVFGGDRVEDSSGDLGSIHTGDETEIPVVGELGEGEAVVLIENDDSGTTLDRDDSVDQSGELEPPSNETGIFAQLEEDETAIDFTNKSFPGVIVFQAGSISGDITNDDDLLQNTFVWTAEFELENANTAFEVTPNFTASPIDGFDELSEDPATANDQVSNLVFDIEVIDTSGGSVVEEVQATGEELKSIDLADRLGSVSQASVDEFNLLRSQSEHGDGDYSMDQVPATDNNGVDYRRLTAYQYDTADSGNGSTAEPVRTGFTVEGNVVIVGADPIVTGSADRTVDSAELAPGESTQVTLNVDLDVAGDVFIQETFDPAFGDVEIVDADGADFANVNEENNEIVASWGDVESATLVYEVNVSGDASAGDSYTLTSGAESDFDAGSDAIDVVDAGPSVADYANDDGVVDTNGLQDAIDDWRSGVIDTDLLQDVIDAWRTGEVVTESPV